MRTVVTILLLFIYSTVMTQAGADDVRKAITELNKALLQKDSVTLKKLSHENLTYGHSNGWIETRQDVIGNLYNGKLTYTKIEQQEPKIWMEGKTATVRKDATAAILLDGKPMELKLHVLQVWVKTKKGWQLVSRQSVKLG
ncbi:MAG: nuclear transport factor 2 family protein [Sphingobacteriales bacterium]|nr:MAG: nuclear transport factor 2 family protein [Sphingobacteriales bacterium]